MLKNNRQILQQNKTKFGQKIQKIVCINFITLYYKVIPQNFGQKIYAPKIHQKMVIQNNFFMQKIWKTSIISG